MTVRQLRESIIAALEEFFPDVPVYVDGNKPQIAYFRVELISSTYDRQREGKYMAVYRYGIRYEQGSLLDSEGMADGLCEALAVRERAQPSFRVMRQAWEAGTEGNGPLFTVDYMLYLHKEQQPDTGTKMMEHLIEGERLK